MYKNLLLVGVLSSFLITGVNAAPRDDIMAQFATLAKASDASFIAFDAERGKNLFSTNFGKGKPETPACTSCHSSSPTNIGETRAGKAIDPLAISKTPDRYSDPKKVEKWFRRNCKSVLGRECTPVEKGDFITYMISQ